MHNPLISFEIGITNIPLLAEVVGSIPNGTYDLAFEVHFESLEDQSLL